MLTTFKTRVFFSSRSVRARPTSAIIPTTAMPCHSKSGPGRWTALCCFRSSKKGQYERVRVFRGRGLGWRGGLGQ